MLRKMTVPGESIAEEESEDTDDIASVSDTASVRYTESSEAASPASTHKDRNGSLSPEIPPLVSPARTRSHGKAVKEKNRVYPYGYKGFEVRGVVYLPGDINGLTKKLHLFAAEFFAGNTTARTELVQVLDALIRLK